MKNANFESFFDFEIKNNLFDRKLENGICYWDILRFPLSMYLFYGKSFFENDKKQISRFSSLLRYSFLIAKSCLYLLTRIFVSRVFSKEHDYFLVTSRYKSMGKLVDNVTIDWVRSRKYSVIIETNIQKIYENDCADLNYLFSRFLRGEDFPIHEFELIGRLFHEHFDSSIEYSFINGLYQDFQKTRKIYTKLFGLLPARKIFVNQNGFRKGIFAAGKDKGLEVFEFQHGFINSSHLSYSYPPLSSDIIEKLYLPGLVLLFSNSWLSQLKYPTVFQTLEVGNNYNCSFLAAPISKDIESNLLVITSKGIDSFVYSFLLANREELQKYKRIALKCHPNQAKADVIDRYSVFKNFIIYFDEISVSDLVNNTESVLTVDSTVIYEALQLKKRVFIIQGGTYFMHSNLFGDPNVKIITSLAEITLDLKFNEGNYSFFKPLISSSLIDI